MELTVLSMLIELAKMCVARGSRKARRLSAPFSAPFVMSTYLLHASRSCLLNTIDTWVLSYRAELIDMIISYLRN